MAKSQLLRGLSTVSFYATDHAAAKKWYSELRKLDGTFRRSGFNLRSIMIRFPAAQIAASLLYLLR